MVIKETLHALAACVVTFVLCSIAYPAAVWGLGQLFFPEQAEGSLIYGRDRTVIGSALIAQPFASDSYFQPRPSAAGSGYAADAASGSNLATTNPALRQRIVLDVARQLVRHTSDADLKGLLDRLDAAQAELKTKNEIAEKTKADTDAIAKLEAEISSIQDKILARSKTLGEDPKNLVPVDLVTASGGGLDPHISPASARYQADRVARARRLTPARVLELIDAHTETSGALIGAPPRVNVLELNRALDEEKAPPAPEPSEVGDQGPPAGADVAALRSQVRDLLGRLDQLGEEVKKTNQPAAAAAVKELEARVAALADTTSAAAALSTQVGRIEERVKTTGETIAALRSEFDEVRSTLKQHTGAGTAPATATTPRPRP
jgi:K+-transporting ATPase ATPase C chain